MAAKFIPFEDVEKLATIDQLAKMLNLDIKRSGAQWRCECPVHSGDHRTLCISPQVRSKRGSEGVFFCQADKSGGDRIGLVAHCMELGQQDAAYFIAQQFGAEIAQGTVASPTVDSTVSENRASPQREHTFDPQAFAKKLEYTEAVQALGITEPFAVALGIGAYRGKLYIAMRHVNGDISGFAAVEGAKLPKTLLPMSNVVALKRA